MNLCSPFPTINNNQNYCFQNYRFKRIKDYTYDTQTILGKGSFSTVHPASKNNNRQLFAIKVIKLNNLTSAKLQELLEQEINIICGLDHPNIIRCHQVLKSYNHCYFVTELCQQGNLEKTLKERGPFREQELWPYVRDIYQGLKYLSTNGIVHRDIKTANIFLKNGISKIADFGFAIHTRESFQDISIGSPLYMAPQGYINNRYGPKTDVWAFGIVIYELLHGNTPFHYCQSDDDLRNCMKRPLNNSQIRWDISFQLKNLILSCLRIDQNQRISIDQIQKMPYMQKNIYGGEFFIEKTIFESYKSSDCKQMAKRPISESNSIDIETQDNSEKQNTNCKKDPIIKKNQSQKCFQFNCPKVEGNNYERATDRRSINLVLKQSIIKGEISFDESIGLIHFCRVGFKFLQYSVSEEIISGVKGLILEILQQLLQKIDKDMITYDLAVKNRADKETRLKKVVKQYLQKYNSCLLKFRQIKFDIKQLQNKMFYLMVEAQNSQEGDICYCYLLLMFLVCCQYFRCGGINNNYNVFAKNLAIDTCLDEKSLPKTYAEYVNLRMKYQSIIVF